MAKLVVILQSLPMTSVVVIILGKLYTVGKLWSLTQSHYCQLQHASNGP